jgi:hypothetical protein
VCQILDPPQSTRPISGTKTVEKTKFHQIAKKPLPWISNASLAVFAD